MPKASAYFVVDNLNGKHDVKELKRELDTFRGVISVSVSDKSNVVAVDFDNTGVMQSQLKNKIEKLGYNISRSRTETHIM